MPRPLALFIVFACLTAACSEGAAEGGALVMASDWGTSQTSPRPPGHEFLNMEGSINNGSSESITLLSAKPVWTPGSEKVVSMVSIRIAPRHSWNTLHASLGTYLIDPPVEAENTRRGQPLRCSIQQVRPLKGYLLPPTAGPDLGSLLVLHFRLKAPGRYRLLGVEVTYEQDGEVLTERGSFEVAGTVGDGAESPRPAKDDLTCAKLLGATVLP